ncbi:DUF1534 domain-containing protein, partial [Pseudomonas ficuserectae]|uniref:DUF1534 domain-containing protein n=1 Tax=Pseudomonas ficuserectae TaxID=53410 RepID=UPI001C7F0028
HEMHANAEHWHDRYSLVRLSFRTLQRGNAVLDALRPLLNAEALYGCSAFDYSYSPAASG